MHKLKQNFLKYYLTESEKLNWKTKPKKIIKYHDNNKFEWFPDGKINVYQNCISDHVKKNKSKIALITVGADKKIKNYKYFEIDKKVNHMSAYLKKISKSKNDFKVMLHASASIESAVIMLACSKIGLHFSVIFQELESLGILNRIRLFKPDIFFSRLSKKDFKNKFNLKFKKKIKFVFQEQIEKIIHNKIKIKSPKNNFVKSDKNFFTLFTSGSTGAPKGITHSTGGYLLYTKLTCEKQFGMNKNSIVLTASDAGWINGHTYSLFGPLIFGATTILVEKPISLIDLNLLKKILKLKTSIIYLPVTLLRLIKSLDKKMNIQKKYIKAIGSMGEPLAPSVGKWFAKNFLKYDSSIVNTYFQTETGGIICSPRYNQNIRKVPHGSVGQPLSKFLKIIPLDTKKVKEIKVTTPWPGMMKNVINGKKEWNKYWDKKGNFKLFDLATKKKGNIFIHGRKDDVINIRGHRIGSEEIESTVLKINKVVECCVITLNDYLEGAKIFLFIVSKKNLDHEIEKILISTFGTYAIPKKIYYISQIPKTRSGKILRRLIRNILENPKLKNYGDTSTILNYKSLENVKNAILRNG